MNTVASTYRLAAGSLLACTLSFASPAWAKVPQGEADRLGKDLTLMGATRAGNAEGSIPAFDGGITAPPPAMRRAGNT
ncbi:hypothetical protein [Oleomonas cavernae]|uniref:hypothetical protein n=1 Tax=Oleomonas cavernae TaxID=2320859 RepID=UPI0018F3D5E0|nr:hypothetical protein [Oleomonas cavernae]